jgi:hypothetical protein
MRMDWLHLDQVRMRYERELAMADEAWRYRLEAPSLRRAIGLSIMRIGAHIAAEPKPRLARSL